MPTTRRRVLVVLAILLVLGIGVAVPVVVTRLSAGASRLLHEPGTLEFGTIPQGEKTLRNLEVVNEGKRAVTIMDAHGDCPCIVVDKGFARRLEPGEGTRIAVTINAAIAPSGRLSKKLTVLTDDPQALVLQVPIHADILAVRVIKPGVIEFGTLEPGVHAEPRTLEIRPGTGYTMNITQVNVSPADTLEVEVVPKDGGADVIVKVKDGLKRVGPLRGGVLLEMDVEGEGYPKRRLKDTVPVQGSWR